MSHLKRNLTVSLLIIFLLAGGLILNVYVYARVSKLNPSNTASSLTSDEPLQVPPSGSAANDLQSGSTFSQHDVTIPQVVNGLAPVISHLPTSQSVVFLGIDDGANKQDFELNLMRANNIRASLFLSKRFIKDNPDFFKGFVAAGSRIEDHTLDHELLPNLSYEAQKQEICGEAEYMTEEYGRRPILFRPPGGSYNLDTQRAAAACGMRAVVLWMAKANGGSMQYQNGHQLHRGDIVLMHFRPEFAKDMQSFITAQNSAGLHTELLENWL